MRPAIYSALFSYDRDSLPYFQRANIMDGVQRSKIDRLIKTVKRNANWNDARIYLLRSTQNIGSGSTVYTLGGWSADNHTLVNSPTWTTNGVDFNGTTQYGIDPNDIWAGGTALTLMADFIQDTAVAGNLISCYSTVSNQRSFALYANNTSSYSLTSNSDGINDVAVNFGSLITGAPTDIVSIYSPSLVAAYQNGASQSVVGTAKASLFNSTAPFTIGALYSGSPSFGFDGKIATILVFKSTLPTANALAIRTAMIGLR